MGSLSTNEATVFHLRKLLQKYEEKEKSFDNTLKNGNESGQDVAAVTSKDILENIQELYKLTHGGKKIKELYECQQLVREKELKYMVKSCRISKLAKDAKQPKDNMTKMQVSKILLNIRFKDFKGRIKDNNKHNS